jgi:hypothetical protein
MTQVQDQINRIPPATPGQEPPFLLRLRQQLDELKAERHKLAQSTLDVPKDRAAFAWRTLAIEPGYPPPRAPDTGPRGLQPAPQEPSPRPTPTPSPPSPTAKPEYIGAERCATVPRRRPSSSGRRPPTPAPSRPSSSATSSSTRAASAATSPATASPAAPSRASSPTRSRQRANTFTKKLENVGCEVCHGPGSLHAAAPLSADSKPQHIQRKVPDELCQHLPQPRALPPLQQRHLPPQNPRRRPRGQALRGEAPLPALRCAAVAACFGRPSPASGRGWGDIWACGLTARFARFSDRL